MWSILIVGLIFIGLMLLFAVWRGLELRQLVESGVAAKASITSKNKFRGKSGIPTFRVRYEFTAQDGKRYSRAISLTGSEGREISVGDEIDIVYLPIKPKISASQDMVALGRQALQKKNGK